MPVGRPLPVEVQFEPAMAVGLRHDWRGVKESEWCAFAMERQGTWMPSLGKDNFDRYDLEYQLCVCGLGSRKDGMPRIDAVGWRGDRATLIETKVKVSPQTMLGGVGQLLYYAEIVQSVLSWDVEELVLMAPAWPSFLLQSVKRYGLPVSLVKITPEEVLASRAEFAP